MKNNRLKVNMITQAALIAALYVVLTIICNSMGLASGVIQVRFSECLTVMAYFTPAAIPGLFIGCLLSNILGGCVILDIIFGSLATLIGALGTWYLRRFTHWLAPLPPILSNMIIVPFVLRYAYGLEQAWWFMVVTVGIGEIISCGILGQLLLKALEPKASRIF